MNKKTLRRKNKKKYYIKTFKKSVTYLNKIFYI